MKQQVNLYRPAFRRERPAFSAAALAAGWVVLVCVLAAGQWLVERQREAAQAVLQSVQHRESEVLAQLETLTGVLDRAGDGGLRARLDEAIARLAQRERLLAMLRGETLGSTAGFSPYLEALARRSIDGMWLTRIVVSGPGGRTTLEGRAREPELVPLYLQSLAHEEALAGQAFAHFAIERPAQEERDVDGVRFSMTSELDERLAQTREARRR